MSIFTRCLFMIVIILMTCRSSTENVKLAKLTSCTCLGYIVTYECTIMGGPGTSTVWRGSAFNNYCEDSGNEMLLLHSRFKLSDNDYTVTCNNGAITGRAVRAINGFYTSQVSIKISGDLIAKTIECAPNGGSTVETLMINTTSFPYPPPEKPSLTTVDLRQRLITFTWSPVAPDCPAIHYNILASNCGSCPTTTNHTTITCSDILVDQDDQLCSFSLQTIVCGNVTGNVSDNAQGLFKAITIEINSGITGPGATVSASILAICLIVCIIVFTTVTVILFKANRRARISNMELEQSRLNHGVPRYEEVLVESRTSIPTNKNMAYGKSLNASYSENQTSTWSESQCHVSERMYAQIS